MSSSFFHNIVNLLAKDFSVLAFVLLIPSFATAQEVIPPNIQKSSAMPEELKLGGLLQFRFAQQQNNAIATSENEDSFRVRRARINLEGTFIEDVSFKFEVDASRQAALEEAEIRLKQFPEANFVFGQFKTQFNFENIISSKKRDFVERTRVGSVLAPDIDLGLGVNGKFFDKRLGYDFSITNGNGKNQSKNDNDLFQYVLRVSGVPVNHYRIANDDLTLALGANYAESHDGATRADEVFSVKNKLGVLSSGRRTLSGVDLDLKLGRASVKAEYLRGEFKPDQALRNILMSGHYLQVGYFLTSSSELLTRYETFDEDKETATVGDINWTTLGFNYFFRSHDLKLQSNYFFKNESANGVDDDTLQVMLQLVL